MTAGTAPVIAGPARFPRFRPPDGNQHPAMRVGPVDTASTADILAMLPQLTTAPASGAAQRAWARAAGLVLGWLETMPGEGWQARWHSCGADSGDMGWIDALVVDQPHRRPDGLHDEIVASLSGLLLCRVVLPSYDFLVRYRAMQLFRKVRQEITPDAFTSADAAAQTRGMAGRQVAEVLTVLSKITLHTGKGLDELTAEDLLSFRAWNLSQYGRHKGGLHGAWDVLRDIGVLDADAGLRATLRRGQPTIEELVDQRKIQCRPVRDVLLRYLSERAPGMDFSSLRQLATILTGTFWADIENHHPGIATLDLPTEVAAGWKERVARTARGRERKGRLEVLALVRGFYLDIQEWAHEDATWAPWAVRCPIRASETEGIAKRNRARTAEVHQRIRERLPHLPVLADTAARHRTEQATLLTLAQATAVGDTFEHEGIVYRRTAYRWDSRRGNSQQGPDAVLVENAATGETTNVLRMEDDAFWAWAIIETLRLTGVRVEELLEITHLALVSYRLPETGEVVPLLQIVPSKSNEERLLLVTPELASVLAAVIHRTRDADGRVPLVSRYDPHERVTGPLLPHLFQRKIGWRREVISVKVLNRLLANTLERAGLTDRAGQPLRYTPHDFRRLFATDAVTGGLPVHIAAKILGHHNLATTHAYLAVFQSDLIQSYRAYLDNRRSYRPAAEYREPTEEEWLEFQKHFELRKVELGTCGRPYGTPCAHEHACIRCAMLRVSPAQRSRLVEIARNLADRIEEARANGWLGEVKGLQVSLEAARKKLVSLDRLSRNRAVSGPVEVGMPGIVGQDGRLVIH